MLEPVLHVLAFLAGAALVAATILSAVRTVVLPHGRSAYLSTGLFVGLHRVLALHELLPGRERRRHGVLSIFAPLALILLPIAWITGALLGFTAMFWSLGTHPLRQAFRMAGSSMLTLGWEPVQDLPRTVLAFFAAALAISVLALLLVTYLPTIHQAYSARELMITSLETFAGEPADPVELILRHHRIGAEDRLDEIFVQWRTWFFSARDSHTALPGLVFFRSTTPHREWVWSSAALLDAAALWNAVCRAEQDPDASLCIRSGALAMNEIAASLRLPSVTDPQRGDPISVQRTVFDVMYDRLTDAGVALHRDRDEGWTHWAGWRVNYDVAVVGLAQITGPMSPPRVQRRR